MLIQDRMQQILLSGSNNTPQTVQNKQCGCRCGSSKNRDHQFSSSPGELSIRHGLNISPSPISSTESAGGDSFGWQFSSEPRHNSVGSQIDKWRKASDDTNTSFLSGEQYPFSTLLGGEANRSNDAIGENIAQNVQSKVLASSFEEPYEFYWVIIRCKTLIKMIKKFESKLVQMILKCKALFALERQRCPE